MSARPCGRRATFRPAVSERLRAVGIDAVLEVAMSLRDARRGLLHLGVGAGRRSRRATCASSRA